MERTLKEVSVEGVKTRPKPNKHIVFAVKVMWSDGQVNVVSRRYSEFFELMEKLNENFPFEAGKQDPRKRILPNLHAKKTFLVSSSVMKQLERITQFTKKLVLLPDHISQCQIVREFFKPTESDLEFSRRLSIKNSNKKRKKNNFRRKNTAKKILSIRGPVFLEQYHVIADSPKQCKTGLDLREGQIVEVIEKLETGWWLVIAEGEQGWVPASYLSNDNDSEETMTTITYQPGQGECYVTNRSYKAVFKDELSFDIGVHLQVIEKNLGGWWRAIYNGCEGLVPATYLKKVGQTNEKEYGNKPLPVRKQSVLSQRDSKSSQSDMTAEAVTKLRESTFKSPEEKEEQDVPPKRKLARVQPKVHLDLRKSVDGGWVPQNIVPATMQPAEKERKKSTDKEKGFSLLKGFGQLMKPRRHSVDDLDNKATSQEKTDPAVKESHKRRSKSSVSDFSFLKNPSRNSVEPELEEVTQQDKHFKSKCPRTSSSVVEAEMKSLESPRQNDVEGNEYIALQEHSAAINDQFSRQNCSKDFPQEKRKKSVNIPKIEGKKQPPTAQCGQTSRKISAAEVRPNVGKKPLLRRSYSCSDVSGYSKTLEKNLFDAQEDQDDQDSHSDAEDNYSSDDEICTLDDLLNEERESKKGLSCEELPADTEPMMSKRNESIDSGMGNSPPSSPEAPIKILHKRKECDIYVAIADYQGSKDDGEVDLFKGHRVRVLQKTIGGWWLVEDDVEQRGWAPSNFLEKIFDASLKELSTEELEQAFCYVDDTKKGSEKNMVQLSKGETFEVVDTDKNGHFVLVRVPSKYAWISKSCVLEDNDLKQCKI